MSPNESLFNAKGFNRDNDALIEELIVLCMIDSSTIFKGLIPVSKHRKIYRQWIRSRVSILAEEDMGGNIYASFRQLNGPRRGEEIESRFERLVKTLLKATIATAIKRTQENSAGLMKGKVDILELLI
jgi:hypothetical protein